MEDKQQKIIEPLYDKKYKCPFCEDKFTSKKVRSRYIKPLRVDKDFGPIFKEELPNPLYYYAVVCPECGFSFSEDFAGYLSKAARERIENDIRKKWDKSNYCGKRDLEAAVKSYKLAIYSGQLAYEKHIVFANLCLRLAWIYRNVGDNSEENRFLQLAAKELEESYMSSDFVGVSMTEIQILYLTGEIKRRIGQYNEAVRFFTSVVEHPDKNSYHKYVNLSREQWKLAVQEFREQKENKN